MMLRNCGHGVMCMLCSIAQCDIGLGDDPDTSAFRINHGNAPDLVSLHLVFTSFKRLIRTTVTVALLITSETFIAPVNFPVATALMQISRSVMIPSSFRSVQSFTTGIARDIVVFH